MKQIFQFFKRPITKWIPLWIYEHRGNRSFIWGRLNHRTGMVKFKCTKLNPGISGLPQNLPCGLFDFAEQWEKLMDTPIRGRFNKPTKPWIPVIKDGPEMMAKENKHGSKNRFTKGNGIPILADTYVLGGTILEDHLFGVSMPCPRSGKGRDILNIFHNYQINTPGK